MSDRDEYEAAMRAGGFDAKRVFFDWSFLIPLLAVGMAWGTLSTKNAINETEITRLRVARDGDMRDALEIRSQMATRADVQRVADQINELQIELRKRGYSGTTPNRESPR
jgi:hypothetical protein